ncbi:hypothetical protein [Glycomyces algeriensis]|uniref:Uncharacterized protein n=1 Tax=Glycomyces algeriensis TaxID=256037 RepID=A0A9W6GC36_9ACTN|nr:hypothetical protein [Glycomyces algeriensis]MDA1365630.1 hypothetical protein [Glycomyces algeriensis]MDR7351318.1 hypothetical protein [Glycomyces algeriensis]GLI44034.1 hypothetical protein GALLR39Z86_38840 [Glycomyces algeriensis]
MHARNSFEDAANEPQHEHPNTIVLDFAKRFPDRLQLLVDHWRDAPGQVVDGYAFFLLYCWHGKHRDPATFERWKQPGQERSPFADAPEIRDLVAASLAAIGGQAGWVRMLGRRDYCECGQTSKLENLSVCVDCGRHWCWECSGTRCRGHEVVG